MKEVDINNDNMISFNEFKDIMTKSNDYDLKRSDDLDDYKRNVSP